MNMRRDIIRVFLLPVFLLGLLLSLGAWLLGTIADALQAWCIRVEEGDK